MDDIAFSSGLRFTAYQFFNEKQKIAEVMRDSLNQYFSKVGTELKMVKDDW